MCGLSFNIFPVKEILVHSYVRNDKTKEKVEVKHYSVNTTISELRKHVQKYISRSKVLYGITTSIQKSNGSFQTIEVLDRNPDGSKVTLNDLKNTQKLIKGEWLIELDFHIESRVSFDGVNSEDTVSVRHRLRYYQDPQYSFHDDVSLGNKGQRVTRKGFEKEYPRNTTMFKVCKDIYQKRCISEGLYLREVYTLVRRPFNHRMVIHAHDVLSRSLTIEDIQQLAGANNNNAIELFFQIYPKEMHPITIPSNTFPAFFNYCCLVGGLILFVMFAYVFMLHLFSSQP